MLTALLLAAAAAAQEPPPTVREEVRVHLVRVPLRALDRQDRPVADLRPEEVVAEERGRRVEVAYLEALAPAGPAEPADGSVRLTLDAPGGWEGDGAFPPSAQPRYVAVLVDAENDDLAFREEARAQVEAALRRSLDPAVRASVFSWDGTLRQEVPFTADREALASALAQAWSRTAPAAGDPDRRLRELMSSFRDCAAERVPGRCLRDAATLYADEVRPRAAAYAEGLGTLVRSLAGVDGSKTILLLGHGVPLDPEAGVTEAARAVLGAQGPIDDLHLATGFGEGARAQLDRVLAEAVRARVTLHVIDRSTPPDDRSAARGEMLAAGALPLRAAWGAAQRDMAEAAGATGGLFEATPAPGPAVSRALDAGRGAYELGYAVPGGGAADPATLKLRCTRKGVRLVRGRGVSGLDPAADATLAGNILVEAGPAGTSRLFVIQADPRPLGYRLEGEEAVGDYTVHVVLRDAAGRAVADAHHFLRHAYPKDLWTSGRIAPVVLRGRLTVPPGTWTLTAAFRSVRGEAGGRLAAAVASEAAAAEH